MFLRITHVTRYRYPSPAVESHSELRLKPISDGEQVCREFALRITPACPTFELKTPFGAIHYFNYATPHSSLEIAAESIVETRPRDLFAGLNLVEDDWNWYRESAPQAFSEYLAPTRLVPEEPAAARIASVAARHAKSAGAASFLLGLNELLQGLLSYDTQATRVDSTLREVLENRGGVCQDFTHLMLAVCRSHGIPARYVSGYMLAGPGAPDVQGGDAMHAWVECVLPGGIWHGFDPTNNLVVNDRYVKVHTGRDYSDVAPTRGVYRGPADHEIEVEVRVAEYACPTGLRRSEFGGQR